MELKLKIQTSTHLRSFETLFVGQTFHDLPNVGSTNDFALYLLSKSKPPEGTIISTFNQTKGRGQLGNTWESNSGLNISLSIILFPDFMKAADQFILNQSISLALADLVGSYLPKTKVKWPNDIYVGNNKIAGTLIQNTLSGDKIKASVIGIGLNVNQVDFSKNIPNPTSFKSLSGKDHNLDEIIAQLCQSVERRYLNLKAGKVVPLQSEYLERLFRFGESSAFQRPDGQVFHGKICGISPHGKLQISHGGAVEEFALKEISFVK